METETIVFPPAFTPPCWFPQNVNISPRGESWLNIRGFQHQLPIDGINYFTTTPPTDIYCGLTEANTIFDDLSVTQFDLPNLCIGMAFYNEDHHEIRRSLVSLSDQVQEIAPISDHHVVIVSDGHTQMNDNTKKYLRALYCTNPDEEEHFDNILASLDRYVKCKADADEDERINTPMQDRKQPPPPLTYIIQRVCTETHKQAGVRIRGGKDNNNDRFLRMTLILKSLNRRKHNSQEWMFNYAKLQPLTDLLFLTDCGTLFGKGCLLRLVAYMKDNEKCVGCTGRQRVMTSEEQDCEHEGLSEKFFRLVQTADYEGSYATYTGAFSLIGFLAVLPGPCCMMRFSAIHNPRTSLFFFVFVFYFFFVGTFRPPDPLEDVIKESRQRIDSQTIDPFVGLNNNPSQETLHDHFEDLVATPPQETNLAIENVKLAEDRIPSYLLFTHGQSGVYTTWVDGAIFYFQAETSLESFAKQRRRWINGSLFSYIWLTIMKPHLILGSSHNFVRRYCVWLMFLMQLFTYCLAMISPAIFGSGLYLGLISLFQGEAQTIILISTILFGIYTWAFVWVHRYRPFVKPLFFFMMFLNMVAMVFTFAGYIRQASAWGFSPTGIDRQIIQWTTIAIIATPFVMSLIALNFTSFWLLIKSCIPYWLFLPTLVGSFTLYGIARVSDTSWGNRVSVAGSNFKSATQHELAQLQAELSSNSLVALIFLTALNILIECLVIYYGVNSWFIVGVLVFIFSTTIIQALISIVYFMGKHISGLTFWEKFGCCLCCKRRLSYTPSRESPRRRSNAPLTRQEAN